jgi:hypothetical protein
MAFKELKLRFIKALLLILFDLEKQIKLKTNALDLALKAIISQPNKANK